MKKNISIIALLAFALAAFVGCSKTEEEKAADSLDDAAKQTEAASMDAAKEAEKKAAEMAKEAEKAAGDLSKKLDQ